MVLRGFSGIYTGSIDILLWGTPTGMAFGIIMTADEFNIKDILLKRQVRIAPAVFVMLSQRN